MKINRIFSLILITTCLGCTKQYGCTNIFAVNFDTEAELSNHSCYYHEVVNFRIQDFRMDAYVANDVEFIRVFFNEEFIVKKEIDPDSPYFKVNFTRFEKRRDYKLLIIDNKDSVIRESRFRMSNSNQGINIDI